MAQAPVNISGLILAGGKGTRMNTVNKGLQLFRGQMLIQHVINIVADQVDDIVISANADLDTYRSFGYSVCQDVKESYGPLSGIKAAAGAAKHDSLFITACDMPYLPASVVTALSQAPSPVVVAKSNEGIEPLVCLVNGAAIKEIDYCLANGQYSVSRWLRHCGAVEVDLTHLGEQAFANINTLEDLQQIVD